MHGDRPVEGLFDGIVAMFAPFTGLSKQLQAIFQLDRPPAVRKEHGRLEILLRGTGMTDAPLPDRVSTAHQISDAARPLIREHRKRDHRRFADRAIAVTFEDEKVMDAGIATSRFTYVALMPHD